MEVLYVYCVCPEQKYPVKELVTDGKEVLWDSKKGFILQSHIVSYAGVVYCETIIQNETYQSSPYIVAVVGKVKPLHVQTFLDNIKHSILYTFHNMYCIISCISC